MVYTLLRPSFIEYIFLSNTGLRLEIETPVSVILTLSSTVYLQ
jgi:hypothetical protein